LKLNALKISIVFIGLVIFFVAKLKLFETDEEIEQQLQTSTVIEQEITNQALKPELISKLVLTPDNSVIPPEFIKHLPSSLLNTPLPELLDVNQDGSLSINKKILHLFEFYLSAMGEESLEVIVTRIKSNLSEQLTGQALDEALHILEGYMQYRNEITVLKQEYNRASGIDEYSFEDIIDARNELAQARWRFLSSEVIAAFFEQEDEYESYMLRLAVITKDQSLSKEQKDNAVAMLNAQTPSWLIEQQNAASQLNSYRQQYRELVSQGATDSELSIFREQEFDVEVSDRLAKLDTKRLRWQHRLSEYRIELETILAIESDHQAQQTLIDELRRHYFSSQEVRRVRALDSHYLTSLTKGG